jgi:hypothetical protein
MREVGCRSPHISTEQFPVFMKISQLNQNFLRVCMKFCPSFLHFCLMWKEFGAEFFFYWLVYKMGLCESHAFLLGMLEFVSVVFIIVGLI